MDAKERVLAALDFRQPDRTPIFDQYWTEFADIWRREKGLPPDASIEDYYHVDICKITPNESPFPSQRQVLGDEGEWTLERDGWGMTKRSLKGGYFYEEVAVALPDKSGLDGLVFESPTLDRRFAAVAKVDDLKRRRCAFVKIGGPYLRTSNLRGASQWLVDLAEDPGFAKDLAMRVAQHITAVGLEAIRRYDLYETGIWFFDDMAWNDGPMFSPRTFRRVFLPCYEWMCQAFREAGVRHIMLHSDGNIGPILDMLIDAGIMAINPVEPKAGMHASQLRQRYGRNLALIGGLCNAAILPRGTPQEIEAHVLDVLSAGVGGGLVIGTHSIGPDVPVSNYDLAHRVIQRQDAKHLAS
jgi:uroporphyrinogen decarboxylase